MDIEKFLEERKNNNIISDELDIKILEYLKHIDKGFFIEAGAFDGIFQSNTKILEDFGWNGILIEPSVNAFNQCLTNRKCYVENCALVSFDYKDEFVNGNFDNNPRSSILRGQGVYSVKAKTLTSILDEKAVTKVDFFSLDVEGYEMEVLKGIDFDKIDINYILIEVNSEFYSLEQLDKFMLERNYKNIANISNFSFEKNIGWPGNHQDYLYKKTYI
jgi:FkbM family methyltransferase